MESSKNIRTIEEQIRRKQEKLFKLKEDYDKTAEEIADLLKKKKLLQTEELVKEIGKSKKTYEEIIAFIREGNEQEQSTEETEVKRRGRKRKNVVASD